MKNFFFNELSEVKTCRKIFFSLKNMYYTLNDAKARQKLQKAFLSFHLEYKKNRLRNYKEID